AARNVRSVRSLVKMTHFFRSIHSRCAYQSPSRADRADSGMEVTWASISARSFLVQRIKGMTTAPEAHHTTRDPRRTGFYQEWPAKSPPEPVGLTAGRARRVPCTRPGTREERRDPGARSWHARRSGGGPG